MDTYMKPYTFHTEREERYHRELREIRERHWHRENVKNLEAQALRNACSSEFVDATMKLSGKRVRINYKGRIFSTDYTVLRIVKLEEVRADERACFGIVHKWAVDGKEEVFPIFPSTKILIHAEVTKTHEPALRVSAS